MKTASNRLKNNYQAKAEYNGINPVIVHDSSINFPSAEAVHEGDPGDFCYRS
jgi:hypothetical protein